MFAFTNKIINAVLCIIFILNMGTVYCAMYYNQISLISVAVAFVVLLAILFDSKIKVPVSLLIGSLVYVLYFIPYALLSKAGSGILLFSLMIPVIFLVCLYYDSDQKIDEFLNCFIECILMIGFISLFFWMFGSILHIISPTGTVPFMWSGEKENINTYFFIYFEPQRNSLNIGNFILNTKNCGVFNEAPMASFAYSTALIANAYLKPINHFREIFLLILILTTQSTTGIIIVLIYTISLLYKKRSTDIFVFIIKITITLCITIIVAFLVYKLVQMKIATGSGEVRSSKFKEEFYAFLQSPLFGNGFNKYTNGSSNSITSIMADGGVMLFGFYYYPVLANAIRIKHDKHLVFLLFLYVLMVSITCIITSYIISGFTVFLWIKAVNNRDKQYDVSRILNVKL